MQRAADKQAAVQRGAAPERTEMGAELSMREDLEGLLPEGVSAEVALQLLTSAGLTIEEALELYERGELESRAQELGPEELAALTEIVEGTEEEGPVEAGRQVAGPRTACSCGGSSDSDKDEEDEDEKTSTSRATGPRLSTRRGLERAIRQPGRSLIVSDAARRLASGQMRRSAFLARLETVVRSTAEAALSGTGRSARDCPYIERSLRYYRTKDGRHVERAVQRYAPAAIGARSTAQYLVAIQGRVQTAVARWARTGEITGVPRGVPAPLAPSLVPAVAASRATRPVLRSADDGEAAEANPHAIRARLGGGHPLESSVRGRMESVFGANFSSVRVHTDAGAATLSSGLRACAFAVGDDVAFAGGRYAPGTPVGDALIAHELAHVLQQRGSAAENTTLDGHGACHLEQDADYSARSVLTSLWQNGRDGAAGLAHEALPRLRSGLRLSRCKDEGKKPSPPTPGPTPTPTPAPTPPPKPAPKVAACKPTMKSFEAKKTGAVEMTDKLFKDAKGPVCAVSFASYPTPGITFEAEVDVPRGCTGQLEYLQVADYCVEERDDDNLTWVNRSCSGLDTQDPYGSKPVTSAGKVTFKDEDSPGFPPSLGKDRLNVKKANYTMYLLWRPDPPTNPPRVGLGVASWYWKANTAKTGSSGRCADDWKLSDVDASGGKGAPTSTVPTSTPFCPQNVKYFGSKC